MRQKSILMISNFLPQPAYNKNIWHALAERLAEAGWDVITTSDKINRFTRLFNMVSTIHRERKRYNLAQIDVFSGKAFIFAEISAYLLQRLKKPIVLTLHGGRLPKFASEHPRRVRRLLQAGTAVMTPSHFLQDELREFHPNIKVIPNPIELAHAVFRPRHTVKPNLIWIRAFHSVYNPSMAVKVLHTLITDFPKAHLTMVGPDKGDGSRKQMLSLVRQYHLEDAIEVLPGVSHDAIPQQLNQADIFINTSNYDTFPRSIIEAMANGLCIVSTHVGGIPYLISNHQEGLLVPPDKPDEMASAIREILQNTTLASYLSQNARKKAEAYDWSAILPQWENLFTQIIEAHDGQA
ncbi:MAG: glycosyltransferase family 4 protein [Brevefilum sp.]|nr:glycosyltransferase family 4 protein [Brevefilum sp.]